MVTVKLLKPYYIKMNSEYIRIILAYQYFSLFIDKQVYHFVPIEGQEILINRKTKQVVNTETKFAFQKGKEIIYITVKKLTTLVDFMDQLDKIIKPYYNDNECNISHNGEVTHLIQRLEVENIIRLIDRSLDEKDKEMFDKLTNLLAEKLNELVTTKKQEKNVIKKR